MTRRIAAILTVLCALTLTNGAQPHDKTKYSVLSFRYTGPSDAEFSPIVISDSQAGADWFTAVLWNLHYPLTHKYVVSAPLMKSPISEAVLYRARSQPKIEGITTCCASVTLTAPGGRGTFVLGSRDAVSMLNDIEGLCKDDEPLASNLSSLQELIRPFMSQPEPAPRQNPVTP